uniref:Alpha/beta hydrolase fold-3 domain-containing protein n=1 Tax=Ananas comosus var. bracteatus TaxID=296719 RepID=A0A6V7Q8L1_ANACO|nr:unnamed protein product [Ananas comosus var. bracteatus]
MNMLCRITFCTLLSSAKYVCVQAINTVVAGILHDVVDDTVASLSSIEVEFGDDVAHLVAGVSKLSYKNQLLRRHRRKTVSGSTLTFEEIMIHPDAPSLRVPQRLLLPPPRPSPPPRRARPNLVLLDLRASAINGSVPSSLAFFGGGGGDPCVVAHGDPAQVFLAGDSAGANIAHNAAVQAGRRRGWGLCAQGQWESTMGVAFECLIGDPSLFGFSVWSSTVFRPMTRIPRSEDEILAPKSLNCRFWAAIGLDSAGQSTGTTSAEYRYWTWYRYCIAMVPVPSAIARLPEARVFGW